MKTVEFTLTLEGAVDPAASLEFFRRNGDDLLDRWDGRTLVRTNLIGGRAVAYACTFTRRDRGVIVRVRLADGRHAETIASAVRAMFVMPTAHFAALARSDAVIGALDARYPGVRSAIQSNLFHALIRCITTQQVNLKWAATCRRRLAEAFGDLHEVGPQAVYAFDPARLAALDPAAIRALQLTTRKAEYLVNLAHVIASKELDLDGLVSLSDDEVIARLTAIRGLGRWTAEWILARGLGRPRVVAGDLGVRKAVGLAYYAGVMPSETEVRTATAHWGASAAVAQALLLHGLAEKTLAAIPAAVTTPHGSKAAENKLVDSAAARRPPLKRSAIRP